MQPPQNLSEREKLLVFLRGLETLEVGTATEGSDGKTIYFQIGNNPAWSFRTIGDVRAALDELLQEYFARRTTEN